ncbi:phage head closure protein [Rummeliibacillus sp. TYF-LIM-RU47]|uniref:phage head closure protein n=1 Tax=Rummeliibacillus sp. TYF-LIM-RU47 TaxID=2608406 RepID=UPI00123AD3E1|nr:phage head closure protein [Rummeliibacillus sp. TYF-LIM-RU47]
MRKSNVNRLNCRIHFFKTEMIKNDYGDRVPKDIVLFSCWAEFFGQSIQNKISAIGTVFEDTVFFNVPIQMQKQLKKEPLKIRYKDQDYKVMDVGPSNDKDLVRITAEVVS